MARAGWAKYEKEMGSRPLRTMVLTTGALWGSGDYLAQKLAGRNNIDVKRTIYTSIYAGVLLGPLTHVWYNYLEKVVSKRFVHGSKRSAAAKVAMDLILMEPVYVAATSVLAKLADGKGWDGAVTKLTPGHSPGT